MDKTRVTQVGRAMRELNIEMIPAYSPQARGRSERSFGTWQNRLPQELRLAGISTIEDANRFLREQYITEFNRMFAKPAREKGTAFRKCDRKDLDQVFSIQTERTVAKDNTIAIRDRHWQLDRTPFRRTLADCRVTICERFGRNRVGALGATHCWPIRCRWPSAATPAGQTPHARFGTEQTSLRQQRSRPPLSRFPSGESRGGRVPPTPGARRAPAKDAGTRRCCRLPRQEGCRPIVNPPPAQSELAVTGWLGRPKRLTGQVLCLKPDNLTN